jgi:uncharacterized protein YbbC (DUF1343 family)
MKFLFALSILFACSSVSIPGDTQTLQSTNKSGVIVGAERVDLYLPLLKGKKVAVVANATSTIGKRTS